MGPRSKHSSVHSVADFFHLLPYENYTLWSMIYVNKQCLYFIEADHGNGNRSSDIKMLPFKSGTDTKHNIMYSLQNNIWTNSFAINISSYYSRMQFSQRWAYKTTFSTPANIVHMVITSREHWNPWIIICIKKAFIHSLTLWNSQILLECKSSFQSLMPLQKPFALYTWICLGYQQDLFKYKDCLCRYCIPIIKIRWSQDCLVFIMRIPTLTIHLYIETVPRI